LNFYRNQNFVSAKISDKAFDKTKYCTVTAASGRTGRCPKAPKVPKSQKHLKFQRFPKSQKLPNKQMSQMGYDDAMQTRMENLSMLTISQKMVNAK